MPTETCTTCGRAYEDGSEEQAREAVRLCPDCDLRTALVDARDAMLYAAVVMGRRVNYPYPQHAEELRGAAYQIEGWLAEIKQEQPR